MTLENAKEGDWLAIYRAGSKEMEQVVRVTKTMVKTDRYTFRRNGRQVTGDTWTGRRRAGIATDKERTDFLEVEQAKSTAYEVGVFIKKISQANDSIVHALGFKHATGYVPILNTAMTQLEAALATLQAPPTSTPAPNHDA